ncbi:hypothetical protein [Blautia sp.]|uniref:Uncharacterized protein n=1 Tax=Blautia glucerasea TaxID=536633 RepID=A0A6N2SGF8_9FIRM
MKNETAEQDSFKENLESLIQANETIVKSYQEKTAELKTFIRTAGLEKEFQKFQGKGKSREK